MTEYRPPTEEQIREAVRRILTPQLRRAFFEGLKNPLWVEPLAKEGAFSAPPEPESTDDGLVRDIYWPEIDYLIRAAPDSPAAVVDVLLKLGKSTNAWVRRGAFKIGGTIPADEAARLRPLINGWQSTGFGWRTDPNDLVSYAVNLLEGGQNEVGQWFASLLFKPSKSRDRFKPSLALEDYWYEQGLPMVAAALGARGFELVLSWLVGYERHSGHLTPEYDITYLSRDSVRHAGGSVYEAEQALIEAVRDLAVDAMLIDGAGTVETLLNSNMLLARKIALFSVGEALERLDRGDARVSELLSLANELLSDDASADDSCRIDYAELARAVARKTGEPIGGLTEFIERGPRIDGDRLRDWVSDDASNDADVDARTREFVDRWKHRWLAAIGADALPAQLRTSLADFDSRFGAIENPLLPTDVVRSWTGPDSPLSQDEMNGMSAGELVAHLESWRQPGRSWGPGPSHEGQGQELAALLTTNPNALVGVDDLVRRLRPTYLRAVLRGWEAALKAGMELNWAQVADLIGGVLAHSDESAIPAEGGKWDDDVDLRQAKQAAVGLLEELAQRRSSPTIDSGAMERFAEMLITLAADERAWTEYVEHDSGGGSDPLTTSLNWQWPIRLRGLIHLMHHGIDTPWYNSARTALETELVRDDTRGASRAVLGEGLGRLVDVDPDWLAPKVADWFGSGDALSYLQQVALTTAMAVHRYHPTLYELLSVPMVAALESDQPIASGWSTHTDPLQRIGEWAIDAIIRGHKTIGEPAASEFFLAAPAKIRGQAIGHIAWAFMHAEVVDDEIRDRFADLWGSSALPMSESTRRTGRNLTSSTGS